MKPLLYETKYSCGGSCIIAVNEDSGCRLVSIELDCMNNLENWRTFEEAELFLLNVLDQVKQVRRLYETIDN